MKIIHFVFMIHLFFGMKGKSRGSVFTCVCVKVDVPGTMGLVRTFAPDLRRKFSAFSKNASRL